MTRWFSFLHYYFIISIDILFWSNSKLFLEHVLCVKGFPIFDIWMQLFRNWSNWVVISNLDDPPSKVSSCLLHKSWSSPTILTVKVSTYLFVSYKLLRFYLLKYLLQNFIVGLVVEVFRDLFSPLPESLFTNFKIYIFDWGPYIIFLVIFHIIFHPTVPIHTCHLTNFDWLADRDVDRT